ncbi:hypothetical protein EDD63_10621 [Breznakia blatticola]|uniref:Uncharacterized protein n=1 Tax=Breznakia blatticola TaxID=1754012 RepID=A0A4R8A9L6_9FIRM|nr:hypothetical protein EDD63_10621 [Breznakia blatticola]
MKLIKIILWLCFLPIALVLAFLSGFQSAAGKR